MIKFTQGFHTAIYSFFTDTVVNNKCDQAHEVSKLVSHNDQVISCSVVFGEVERKGYYDFTFKIDNIEVVTGELSKNSTPEEVLAYLAELKNVYYSEFVSYVMFAMGVSDFADDSRNGFDINTAFGVRLKFEPDPVTTVVTIYKDGEKDPFWTKSIKTVEAHPDSLKSFVLFSEMLGVLIEAVKENKIESFTVDPVIFK